MTGLRFTIFTDPFIKVATCVSRESTGLTNDLVLISPKLIVLDGSAGQPLIKKKSFTLSNDDELLY